MSVEVRDLIPKFPNSQVDIHVHVPAQLNITPFVARQKVSGVVLSQVGTGVSTDEPVLVGTNERLVWRVPVFLALPGLGRLGDLGQIDVDVQTGQVLADQAMFKQLIENTQRIVTPLKSGIENSHGRP
jgi:hypothetical protein